MTTPDPPSPRRPLDVAAIRRVAEASAHVQVVDLADAYLEAQAELADLRQRIVTTDLDGRTVRYDRVAECDAALAATEQQLEAAQVDRDAAQAHAYRAREQVTATQLRASELVDAVLANAGDGWDDDDTGEDIALRYVRHLEDAVARIVPHLNTSGVARLLGVSRPRVVQLRAKPGFPPPDAIRDRHPYWHEHTIRRWAEAAGRTCGPTPAAAYSAPGSGPSGPAAADQGPGMPHGAPGTPDGPPAATEPAGPVTYEGCLDVYQPPDGPPYPVLRLTGGSGGAVVYRPDAVVRVTSELHRDGDLLVRRDTPHPTLTPQPPTTT